MIDVRPPADESLDLRHPTVVEDRPRVLVLDDERDIRDWLRVALGAEGWAVNTARTVEEALEMCGRLHPHVAVLDQRLPDGSGLDCARVLRERQPEIQVVLFSAYLDLTAEQAAEELGVRTISKVDRHALFATFSSLKASMVAPVRNEATRPR